MASRENAICSAPIWAALSLGEAPARRPLILQKNIHLYNYCIIGAKKHKKLLPNYTQNNDFEIVRKAPLSGRSLSQP